jgi:single-stranded-DNA-specific exonuclease
MHWQYKSSQAPQDYKALETLLLAHRGVVALQDQEAFFDPLHPDTFSAEDVGIDPVELQKAVDRIHLARDRKEEVVIFGDYDADGVCSTAILWEALRAVGVVAKPFLPHREKHGYGLSMRSLEAVLAEHKPQLLITVDNGVVAHDAFAELARLGIDTILTDHHQPEVEIIDGKEQPKFPVAQVRVHTTTLCGSGVAWFFARALSAEAAQASLELTAIATVADQMKLLGINRSLVVHGMHELRKTERVGLQFLIAKSGVELAKLGTDTLNYGIVPRINAMGRLKHSLDALRLVCTTSPERAQILVNELHATNTARQDLTSEMIDHAIEQAEEWKDQHIIVVASEDYHEGVIGLLAGKLVETYSKPAIAIAIGEKVAKASARSIAGINITELLRQVRDELLEVGGHPLAAGFAALPEKVASVKARLEKLAKEQITPEQLKPSLLLECPLPAELLRLDTAEKLQRFAPFGQGNTEPLFSFPTGVVRSATQVGKESRHLRLQVVFNAEDNPQELCCMSWNTGHRVSEFTPGSTVEVAGTLSINEWKNRRSLQIMCNDLKTPLPVKSEGE